jgi:hypothetical protein
MLMADDQTWVGTVVVTHEGRRIGWKMRRNIPTRIIACQLNMNYFGPFHPYTCEIHENSFEGDDCWERALEWVRGFERHPAFTGFEP